MSNTDVCVWGHVRGGVKQGGGGGVRGCTDTPACLCQIQMCVRGGGACKMVCQLRWGGGGISYRACKKVYPTKQGHQEQEQG